MNALLTSLLLASSFFIYKLISFIKNVRLAKASGLPYTYSLILEFETIAYFTRPILSYLLSDYVEKDLGWPRWAIFMIKNWPWEDKRRAHEKYGDVFLVVGPGGLICYCADPNSAMDIVMRKNDFIKPVEEFKLIEPYGPNIVTAEGKLWRFHVRITAPSFGDTSGVNDLVWKETVWQTKLLASAWSKHGSRELHLDVHSLTLGIIARAGFGKRVDWTDNSVDNDIENLPPGHELSFVRALTDTTKWIAPILILPEWLLKNSPWKDGQKAYKANKELEAYLREMIATEKANLRENIDYQNAGARGNLLTAVMKASASEAKADNKIDGGSKKESFTDDEVMGNLFVFLVAGYETSANAMIYGLVALALHGDLQDQLTEEVDRIYEEAERAGRKELSYTEDFDKFKLTLAFMYEMLRMFPIVTQITKVVVENQRIHGGGDDAGTHVIPPGTRVYINPTGIHYNEKYWKDPYKIDLSRWTNTATGTDAATNRANQLKGTFMTFSIGARSCLGKKFAHSEFVSFFAELLRHRRVEFAEGVSREQAEKDLYKKGPGDLTLTPVLDNIRFRLGQRKH